MKRKNAEKTFYYIDFSWFDSKNLYFELNCSTDYVRVKKNSLVLKSRYGIELTDLLRVLLAAH